MTIDALECKWNIELIGYQRGKRRCLHQRTHNIVVNTGRQFLCEAISASSWSPGGFIRQQNTVVRYIGFGIGGDRQTNAAATTPPLSTAYPGTNLQTDNSVVVAALERPVLATATEWMKQIAAPADYPTATSVRYVATFAEADLNLSPYSMMPLSEIGLYKSSADPLYANGGVGAYPGPSGHLIAYDTFELPKTGIFSIEARWTLIAG